VLRAVYLGQGHHKVTLIYDPLWFKAGAGISGATLLLVALVAILSPGKAAKPQPEDRP
jgi:hypothetical protein